MLVLMRKPGEEIIIRVPGWPPISVMACDTKKNAARIGVDAPAAVVIRRKEVDDAIQRIGKPA